MAKKTAPQPENQEGTALALFPKLNLPVVTAITEEMNASFKTMYTRLEEDIASLPTDMSDPKNRTAVASYAYRISRTKTALAEAAGGVSEDAKAIVKAVGDEVKELKTTLDTLRDKARAPLDAWEEKEERKKRNFEALMKTIKELPYQYRDEPSDALHKAIDGRLSEEFDPEEYGAENIEAIKQATADMVNEFCNMIAKREREEKEAAELELFRKEKAEREAAEQRRKDEEEKAAAAERDRLYREAEEKRIAEQAKLEAQREAELKIAQEKERADKSEREQKEAIEKAERDAKEATARAAEAEERAEREKEAAITAEREASTRREQEAARREREKIEEEKAEERRQALAKERADQERAADIAHRKKLNGEALAALVKACELTDKQAMAVIIAIYKEQIPHVSISY